MLAEIFLSRLPEAVRTELEDTPEALEETLQVVFERGQAAWPEVELEAVTFVAYLGDRIDGGLDNVRAEDLFLACGCTLGDPTAIGALDREFVTTLEPAVASYRRSGVPTDELLQGLRNKLLVADAGELPKIADYRGVGSLRGWLKTSAVRMAINHANRAQREVEIDSDFAADSEDAEHALLRDRFREPFKRAFQAAMQTLSVRDRNFLKMTVIDGMSVTDIARLYDVHRSTASRWISDARETLGEETKRVLQAELGVQWSELESIIALVRSRIDVSVRRLLS